MASKDNQTYEGPMAKVCRNAEERVDVASRMINERFTDKEVRRALQDRFGVTRTTAWRDVRVVYGGRRTDRKQNSIRTEFFPVPEQADLDVALDVDMLDIEMCEQAMEDNDPAVVLVASQLKQRTGTAFRILLADSEAMAAIKIYLEHKKKNNRRLARAAEIGVPTTESDKKEVMARLRDYSRLRMT